MAPGSSSHSSNATPIIHPPCHASLIHPAGKTVGADVEWYTDTAFARWVNAVNVHDTESWTSNPFGHAAGCSQ